MAKIRAFSGVPLWRSAVERVIPNDMERIDEHNDQAMVPRELSSPPLAWAANGSRFVVPPHASMWRVCPKPRRGQRVKPFNTPRGPLHLPLDADFSDLAEGVGHQPGWYILQVVDQDGVRVENIPSACVEVVLEVERYESPDGPEASDPVTCTIQRLTETLQQSLTASTHREQAMLTALTEMTSNVYDGLAKVQESTAAMLTAMQSGFDIASGVSLQKLPPMPELPPPPDAPPQKSFLEFLCSPAGNTTVSALSGVVKAAISDK